jgi:DNA-binding CsgD family transcriptional regulator
MYWLEKLLERFPGPCLERARTLTVLCHLWYSHHPEGREGIAIAEQLGEDLIAARGYAYLQTSLAFKGLIEESRAAALIAAERLQALDDRNGLILLDAQLGEVHALLGEADLAIECCERALGRLTVRDETWVTSMVYRTMGLALFRQGKHAASAEAYAKALPMMAGRGDDIAVAFCLEMLGWLAAGQQRHTRAAWLLGAAGSAFVRGVQTIIKYPILVEPHQQAEVACRAALGSDRYDALYQSGHDCPVGQLIQLAVADSDELATAGPERTAEAADPLTGREQEIAALVARGFSNREIAERLIISKRTVDAHVEHIYAKLGVSSRIQLANWLRE